jgi:hypothetical protein
MNFFFDKVFVVKTNLIENEISIAESFDQRARWAQSKFKFLASLLMKLQG